MQEKRDWSSSSESDLSEYHVDPVDEAQIQEVSVESQTPSKRGRHRIPEQWTKVVSLENQKSQNVKTYVIANDLMMASQIPPSTMERSQKHWRPWFCPREFVKENKGIKMEHY